MWNTHRTNGEKSFRVHRYKKKEKREKVSEHKRDERKRDRRMEQSRNVDVEKSCLATENRVLRRRRLENYSPPIILRPPSPPKLRSIKSLFLIYRRTLLACRVNRSLSRLINNHPTRLFFFRRAI